MSLKKNSPYFVFIKHIMQKMVERGQWQFLVENVKRESSVKTCNTKNYQDDIGWIKVFLYIIYVWHYPSLVLSIMFFRLGLHKVFPLFVILVAGGMIAAIIFVFEKKYIRPRQCQSASNNLPLIRAKLGELRSILCYSSTDTKLSKLFDSLEYHINNLDS